MRGLKQKLALIIASSLLFSSSGINGVSFAEGLDEEGVISTFEEGVINTLDVSEPITGDIAEIISTESGSQENEVNIESAENYEEYKIHDLNRKKYSVNEKSIGMVFEIDTPNLNINYDDIKSIDLKCLETNEIVGKIDEFDVINLQDGVARIVGPLNITSIIDKSKNYVLEINTFNLKNLKMSNDSDRIEFTDEICYEKVLSNRSIILDNGYPILYYGLNNEDFDVKLSNILNVSGDLHQDSELIIVDKFGNNVGIGEFIFGELFNRDQNGCYSIFSLKFNFLDKSSINPDEEYFCRLVVQGKLIMELPVIPTNNFMFKGCSIKNGLINNSILEMDVHYPTNLTNAEFKLYNPEIGKFPLKIMDTSMIKFDTYRVTLDAKNIPRGEYELYYTVDGIDKKVDIGKKITSKDSAAEYTIDEKYIEAGTDNTFTKYSFPIFLRISKDDVDKELLEKIKTGEVQTKLKNSSGEFYPKRKKIVEDEKGLFIISEFGDEKFDDGIYELELSSINNEELTVKISKEIELKFEIPKIRIEYINNSNKMSTNISKFYIEQPRYPDNILDKLIIKDKYSKDVGVYNNYDTRKFDEPIYYQNNFIYGYKITGIIDGYHMEDVLETYSKSFDEYLYTYQLDDLAVDVTLDYNKAGANVLYHDFVNGDDSFVIDLEIHDINIKDDYEVKLVTNKNGSEEIIASSVSSHYKNYTDEIVNNSTTVSFNMKSTIGTAINDSTFDNYYLRLKNLKNGSETLLPFVVSDIVYKSSEFDLYNRTLSFDFDERSMTYIDNNRTLALRILDYKYQDNGVIKNHYIYSEAKVNGNIVTFTIPNEVYLFNNKVYEFDIMQEGKSLKSSSFTVYNNFISDSDFSVYADRPSETSNNELFLRMILGEETSNVINSNIDRIEVLNVNKEKIGKYIIDETSIVAIPNSSKKLVSGTLILDDKIDNYVYSNIRFRVYTKDNKIIQSNILSMDLIKKAPKALLNNLINASYDTRNEEYMVSELSNRLEMEFTNIENISDVSNIKYKVSLIDEQNDSYGSGYIDSKIISQRVVDDSKSFGGKKLLVTIELPMIPSYGDKLKLICEYNGTYFNYSSVKFTDNLYAENMQLISPGEISSKGDMIFYLLSNVINAKKLDESTKFVFSKIQNLKRVAVDSSNYTYSKVGDDSSNNYLICIKTNEIPVGRYSINMMVSNKNYSLSDTITSTDIPRVNNSANYTYVGNSLKEITVYGANLDSNSNYKVYVYKFDSRSELSNESGLEKAYIPELVKVIENVRVNENSDISILRDDLRTLRNGEYSAFFEKESKLVGSCNISIDEVSLDSIMDFEINGGSSTTSTRNISILAKLNGCKSIRYSDNLASLKQQPYQEVTMDEYSKGVAIRKLSLQGHNGKKTIYMQLKDSKGIQSEIISKEILLDIPVEKPVDNNNGSTSGSSSSSGSSNSGSSGGSYGGGGGGYVPPAAPKATGSDINDNSTPEKKLSDISNLAKNIKSNEGVLQIEKKIDEVSNIILIEKDDKKLQNISSQVNKEIINLSKNLKGKKDLNVQKVIEMMGETSLKAIDNIDDYSKKFEEYKLLAGTFAGSDSVLEDTDVLSKFKSELIRKASMTAVQAKTSVQYGEIIPKYVVDDNKISDIYSSKKDNYKDLQSLSDNLLNGSKYIDVKKEILLDLEDNKDLKVSKVELKKEAIKVIKEKNIDVVNIKSDTTLISIDPNNINDTTDYNLVISNRKNSDIKEFKQSKIDLKSLSDKNYLDINLFVGNKKVNNFEKPIKLSFNVDEYVASADLEDMKPMVYCYDDKEKVWEPIGGKYDELSGTITVVRKDLAKYTVLPVSNSLDVSSLEKSAVTREDFIKLIGQSYGFSALSNDTIFEDIDNNSESAKFISAAYEIGIVNGKGEKTFEPKGTLTYEEAAVIIARTLSKLDNKKVDKSLTENLDKVDENNQISSWAKDEFALVYELGILNENAVKNPKSNISEEELKLIIENL